MMQCLNFLVWLPVKYCNTLHRFHYFRPVYQKTLIPWISVFYHFLSLACVQPLALSFLHSIVCAGLGSASYWYSEPLHHLPKSWEVDLIDVIQFFQFQFKNASLTRKCFTHIKNTFTLYGQSCAWVTRTWVQIQICTMIRARIAR